MTEKREFQVVLQAGAQEVLRLKDILGARGVEAHAIAPDEIGNS